MSLIVSRLATHPNFAAKRAIENLAQATDSKIGIIGFENTLVLRCYTSGVPALYDATTRTKEGKANRKVRGKSEIIKPTSLQNACFLQPTSSSLSSKKIPHFIATSEHCPEPFLISKRSRSSPLSSPCSSHNLCFHETCFVAHPRRRQRLQQPPPPLSP